ncbi:hypothetical protein M0R88_08520 [Halorussus gelatinilyticus]|uniref:Lipoprotein n=1 Tax=Halorussus gelatinilyticus TaxID=2937524 RepID=A0A8U0INC0_9EURY|nr:hypothetical protein [Halorussus gelatinilyticus]UPW02125.1 hypothetical protein M0R88_08520 [Halorussus gelatinilyticus]
MKRREALARLGGVLAVGSLGGCLAQSGGGAETPETETTGEETTADRTTGQATTTEATTNAETRTTEGGRTTESTGGSAITGKRFELLDSGCGQPTSEASVEFADGGSSVVVTGTIPGSNDCYLAKLVDASYDSETGTLDLTVASMAKKGADMCAQCIVEIEYEATVSFSGDGPKRVTVTHSAMGKSKTVATAEPK